MAVGILERRFIPHLGLINKKTDLLEITGFLLHQATEFATPFLVLENKQTRAMFEIWC